MRLLTKLTDKAKSIIRRNKATAQAESAKDDLIPKPAGRRSRDFNIFEAMQGKGKKKLTVTKDTYNGLIVSRLDWFHLLDRANPQRQSYIHKGVGASNLNMDLPLKDQETVEVVKVVAFVRQISHCSPGCSVICSPSPRLKTSTPSLRATSTTGQFTCSCDNS